MAKKPTIVRIALEDKGIGLKGTSEVKLLIEQLRYAGILSVYENKVDLYAPKGVVASVWAEQNAKRMQSFGIDAAAVPQD